MHGPTCVFWADLTPFSRARQYTLTLFDVSTWREVDIEVDERLCGHSNNRHGELQGCKPSRDDELWCCILEKAVAVHCGGWMNIKGGQPNFGWAMLTGCKEQYSIASYEGKYRIHGRQENGRWTCPSANTSKSWHDTKTTFTKWPSVGGAGGADLKLDEVELFQRMCIWDDHSFLMSAASITGRGETHSTDGIVDGHAYAILQAECNVCGASGVDLIKLRNPWGHKEWGGEWGDDGAGWRRHPDVKQKLNPVKKDDGIFWMHRDQVRKTSSWPRSWANFSLLYLYSHRNPWANLHLSGRPNTFARSQAAV